MNHQLGGDSAGTEAQSVATAPCDLCSTRSAVAQAGPFVPNRAVWGLGTRPWLSPSSPLPTGAGSPPRPTWTLAVPSPRPQEHHLLATGTRAVKSDHRCICNEQRPRGHSNPGDSGEGRKALREKAEGAERK